MRVLIVTARYRPHRGGLETVVEELSRQLRQADHEVLIITNRYPFKLPRRERINDVWVERLSFLLPDLGSLKAGRVDLWLAGLFFLPMTLIQLYRLMRQFQPDVLNLHYLGEFSFHVWLIHHLLPVPLIVSLHGGDVDAEPYRSRFKRWLFETVMRRARQVTACSDLLRRQALDLTPEFASKLHTVHNGVDLALFDHAAPYPHPCRYVAAVGQLVRHKGFDLLIAAFAQVSDQFPDVDLIIAGDGAERDALRQQAAALPNRIHFLGSVPRETVASLMASASVIVIPSRREPFGIVGLEAMASGRPVIASRIDGLQEALEDAEVDWFPPEDADALARLLASALSAAQTDGIDANRAAASQHSWQRVAEQYMQLYRA